MVAMSRRWNDLSPRTRRLIVAGGLIETGLKIAVLADLRRRSPDEVRGSKRVWAASMVLNTAGLLPLVYFVLARRPHREGNGEAGSPPR